MQIPLSENFEICSYNILGVKICTLCFSPTLHTNNNDVFKITRNIFYFNARIC